MTETSSRIPPTALQAADEVPLPRHALPRDTARFRNFLPEPPAAIPPEAGPRDLIETTLDNWARMNAKPPSYGDDW